VKVWLLKMMSFNPNKKLEGTTEDRGPSYWVLGLKVDLQHPLLIREEIVLCIKKALVVPQEIIQRGKGYLEPLRMMFSTP